MEEPIIDNVEQDKTAVDTPVSTPTLGSMLREAREHLGMSIGDVANQIKFAPRQIEALEADDFKTMPEAAFLKGFVRSYGKLLQMDLDTLFAALPATKVAMLSAAPAKNELSFPNAQTARRQNYIWLGAALVFVIIALGFAIANSNSPAKPIKDAATETAVALPEMDVVKELPIEPAVAASAVELVAPVAIVPVETVQVAQVVAPKVDVPAPIKQAEVKPVTPLPIKVEKPVVKAAKVPVVPALTKPAAVEIAPEKTMIPIDTLLGTQPANSVDASDAAGSSNLRIVFGEESWAEVKEKNGKSLSSKINASGSELNLSGHAPYTVSISHAKSARLYYKGKQVDLTPHINKFSTSGIANLTLE
jgi:cytoskeleton protein RodZ